MTRVFLISTMSVIVLFGGAGESNSTEKDSKQNLQKEEIDTAKSGTILKNSNVIQNRSMEKNISVLDKNISVQKKQKRIN